MSAMRAFIRNFIKAHKIVSLGILAVLAGGGYYWYSSATAAPAAAKYVIQTASLGTVVSSVTGSGQMQATTQIDIKPQVSETVTSIYVKPGDHVKAGQLLIQMDPTNEERALKQAQLSLQNAQLSLAELQTISTTTLLSNQGAVLKAQQAFADASTTLATDYENGFDTLSAVFVSLQTVMTDAGKFVNGNDLSKTQTDPEAYVNVMPSYLQASTQPYSDAVAPAYSAALAAYQQNLADYHAASRNSDRASLDQLFTETYHTTQLVSASVKTINDLLNFVVNNYPKDAHIAPLPSVTTSFQTTFGNDINSANNNVSSVQNVITGIANDRNSLENDALSLEQASETLAELVAGPTPLQIQSQQISIQSAEDNVTTAQQNFDDTSIRAPVAGIIASVPSTVGTTVASPAVSMVGTTQVAQVTLNEVDAAKVALGQQATLTFDAVSGLSLAGSVVEVDPVGTVSQGVVNYNVQIGLAEASGTAQVKPGMSVTADIVTAVRQNVIAVPNAAVTTQGNASYVLEPAAPVSTSTLDASQNGGVELAATKRVPVTVGLSDDTMTEITSGVSAGDQIIVQTLQGGTAAAASTGAPSGGFRGGGGAGALFRLGG